MSTAVLPPAVAISIAVTRRDTNKFYTGNTQHSARGNTPRKDVSTRKR